MQIIINSTILTASTCICMKPWLSIIWTFFFVFTSGLVVPSDSYCVGTWEQVHVLVEIDISSLVPPELIATVVMKKFYRIEKQHSLYYSQQYKCTTKLNNFTVSYRSPSMETTQYATIKYFLYLLHAPTKFEKLLQSSIVCWPTSILKFNLSTSLTWGRKRYCILDTSWLKVYTYWSWW